MIRLAFRNLFQNKARLVISIGGVSLALLLILSLDAVFTGVERQITAAQISGSRRKTYSTCTWPPPRCRILLQGK
jgi:hypothetical protein